MKRSMLNYKVHSFKLVLRLAEWLGDTVEKNKMGEIVIDKSGQTNIPGIFAAGDCTDTPYKQIIVSMGAGATAALGAFDYLLRN